MKFQTARAQQARRALAGAAGEAEIAAFIAARCRNSGLKVTRQRVFEGRDNLIIELRGGHAQTLLFEAHMDTVPLGAMPDALQPRIENGKLFARGACDTKASLAAMLWALQEAAQAPESLSCDLVLLCAVDEEHGASGIRRFVELEMPLAGAIIGEPTELKIVTAHKGCARFAVETRGKAAHSSVPQEGDSAIFQMLEVLKFIQNDIEPSLAARNHALCGAPTLVVGTIRGGAQVNIVPERCEIEIDRRLLPGENPREVVDDFSRQLEAKTRGAGVRFSTRDLLLDPPLDTAPNAKVALCTQAVARQMGLTDVLCGVPFGSDASKVGERGVPSLIFGPGSIAQAHSDCEWVSVAEVETAARFYLEVMRAFGCEEAK